MGGICDEPGHFCQLHHRPESIAGWHTLVRRPIVSKFTTLSGVGDFFVGRAVHAHRKQRLTLVPRRYFSYWISVGALSIIFLIIMLILISQRRLLPGVVLLGSFILFVLWMVGLIVISIELWGPVGSVNNTCNTYVNGMQYKGQTVEALAWLEQHSICEWTAHVLSSSAK